MNIWQKNKEKNPGSIYLPSPLPDKYYRRCKLNFRIRNGNGCFPAAIPTRVIYIIKNKFNL
jgi:hypothetical protein